PGDYKDYRCALDAYDECTNREEENNTIAWDQKSFFNPDFNDLNSIERNTIDLWFNNSSVSEQSSRVVSWEMDAEEGVINIEIERTFTGNFNHYSNSLDDLSFTSSFFYSLVKLDKIASPDYQPILYSEGEKSTFGFFTTDFSKLDANGAHTDGANKRYLNRFNPNLESIDYYLSDTFFKAENKQFLDATIKSFDKINETLADSGMPPLKIVNASEAAGKHSGDLRYNVINLIDRPLANGLLGYGPSVANPLTGETIKAHVNQYSGVIKTSVPYQWDSMVRLFNRGDISIDDPQVEVSVATAMSNRAAHGTSAKSNIDFSDIDFKEELTISQSKIDQVQELVEHLDVEATTAPDFNMPVDATDVEAVLEQEEKRLQYWAENNAYPVEAAWVSSTSKGLIKGIDYDNEALYEDTATKTELKEWSMLSAEQREEITVVIAEYMYTTTLVHELGHNLGLRHNFQGSVDKDNFYSEERATELGLATVPASSSIMDYGASPMDSLPVFGAYDKAAISYAYGRTVEVPFTYLDEEGSDTNDSVKVSLKSFDQPFLVGDEGFEFGQIYHLEQLLKDGVTAEEFANHQEVFVNTNENFESALVDGDLKLKEYGFCSDGHVSLNSNCNRFDEGTNLAEIVDYKEQRYVDYYKIRNTRYNRQDYWDHSVFGYTIARLKEFSEIRDFMEDFERIDTALNSDGAYAPGAFLTGLAANPTYCSQTGPSEDDYWFCSYEAAAVKSANVLFNIVARPDKVCEVKDKNGAVQQLPLSKLYSDVKFSMADGVNTPMSCFEEEFVNQLAASFDQYEVLSETRDGRSLASTQPNDPSHPYSNEIDTIGTWPDKLMAMNMLVERQSRRWTGQGQSMALVDLSDIKPRLETLLKDMVEGTTNSPQPVFVNADGEVVTPHMPYIWDTSEVIEELTPSVKGVARYFGLPALEGNNLIKSILTQVVRFGDSQDVRTEDTAQAWQDFVALPASQYGNADLYRQFSLDNKMYDITSANKLAIDATSDFFVGKELTETIIDEASSDELNAFWDKFSPVYGDLVFTLHDLYSGKKYLSFMTAVQTVDAPTLSYLVAQQTAGVKFLDATQAMTETPVSSNTYSSGTLLKAWEAIVNVEDSGINPAAFDIIKSWLPAAAAKLPAAKASATSELEEKLFEAHPAIVSGILAGKNNALSEMEKKVKLLPVVED
ncbi:MAG: hypothetical protein GY951_02275, partial [Psychromonas sp.]|nr:hypothetical protein [Psychromonas sp.]